MPATPFDNIDLAGLSIDDRTVLAHRLLLSVQQEAESSPLSAELLAEIDRRLDEAEAGRGHSTDWPIVRKRLLARIRR